MGIQFSMGNAKGVQSRLRPPRHLKRAKSNSRTRKVDVRRAPRPFPRQFQSPITGEIEEDLRNLVAKYGEKNVRATLDPLVTKCKWKDWQCVANAIRRLARKK